MTGGDARAPASKPSWPPRSVAPGRLCVTSGSRPRRATSSRLLQRDRGGRRCPAPRRHRRRGRWRWRPARRSRRPRRGRSGRSGCGRRRRPRSCDVESPPTSWITMSSSPSPPSRMSVPGPPISTSSPAPPSRTSLPSPPMMTSLPSPPSTVSWMAPAARAEPSNDVVAGQQVDRPAGRWPPRRR